MAGPFVFGFVSHVFSIRAAVGSVLIFFLVGGGILFFVDEGKGIVEGKVAVR